MRRHAKLDVAILIEHIARAVVVDGAHLAVEPLRAEHAERSRAVPRAHRQPDRQREHVARRAARRRVAREPVAAAGRSAPPPGVAPPPPSARERRLPPPGLGAGPKVDSDGGGAIPSRRFSPTSERITAPSPGGCTYMSPFVPPRPGGRWT